MMKVFKKSMAAVLIAVITIAMNPISYVKAVEEETSYISVEEFSELIAKEINVAAMNGSYVDGLRTTGIIRDGEFASYTKNITRGDALVLLSRADNFLNGTQIDPALVQTAIDKRISDIGKVAEDKRADVAKAYLKGFMKGFSNGAYCTDRELKVTKKITKSGALSCIAMIKDTSKRAKISPDGQLIRTTKLPKSYKNYPYILASFPNAYYDWKFSYEITTESRYNEKTGNMEKIEYINLVDYAKPIDLELTKDIEDISTVKKERMASWVEKARTHMECLFNINYRTSGEEWINKMVSASMSSGNKNSEENYQEMLAKFLARAKKNETVIESSKIATDGSSMYYFDGIYYLRFNVRYRIISSKTQYQSKEIYLKNDLFYTSSPISFNDFKLGEWKECFFDVELDNHYGTEPENLGVYRANIIEGFYFDTIIK